MSYTKRQRSRKKRQAFRIIAICSIFLYLIFRSVSILLANSVKTILPEKGIFIENINSTGVLIKRETLVKANNSGEFVPLAIEGERLGAGAEIASINSLKDTSYLKEELSQIEESISALEESAKETAIIISEREKVGELTNSIVDELQQKINLGNYDDVYLLKEQLVLYEDKAQDMSLSNTLVGQSLDNLETKRDNLKEAISKNHIKYYSDHGGIISYDLDGYEEIFLAKDFENYSYDKLKVLDQKRKKAESSISVGDSLGKIIDNFQWYMAVKIEDIKEITDFKVNQTIKVNIEGSEHELQGRIVAINTKDGKGVIVAEFTTMLHEFYNNRFPKVEIIKLKKESFKVPDKTILDKDGEIGVYIKDKSGIVKFAPINILGSDSGYTYLDIDSITLFDEIFLSPNSVKEGQILN